jgi:CRISPR-associated protein Cst1
MAEETLVRDLLNRLCELVPQLRSLPRDGLHASYDDGANVLYVSLKRPQDASDTRALHDEGLLLRYRDGELVGVTVLDAGRRTYMAASAGGDTELAASGEGWQASEAKESPPSEAAIPSHPRDAVVHDRSDGAGFRWTGHPLVDMGIAILTAFGDRRSPAQLTRADLERFATFAEAALLAKTVRSHASVVFTSNAPYLQPSFTQAAQRERARQLFRSFSAPEGDGPRCVYCGRPSVRVGTSSGRAYREMVPMLTGQGVVNFFPGGEHGLSMCGRCATALQALAIGAPSCEGRALVVAADDPDQLVAVVGGWLSEIRTRIQLSQVTGEKVDTWRSARTRLIERLKELEQTDGGGEAAGFTVYHLSNSGQGPDLAIHTLRASVVGFVRRAQAQAYREAWRTIERRAWRDDRNRVADQEPGVEDRLRWRNTFNEALFRLPQEAGRFIRRHFCSYQRAWSNGSGASGPAALWPLVWLFLQEVMGMERDRIEAIRGLGDMLAEEFASYDHRIFRRAYRATNYVAVRRLLVQTNAGRLRRGEAPLLDFDGFLRVFEDGDEIPRTDWRLAWDLTLIRFIDELHRRGVFAKDAELRQELAETVVSDDTDESAREELAAAV